MENKLPKLISVNYGLASVYSTDNGQVTEINHKLYGNLREKIIKHENRHKSNRKYTSEDLKNDFASENSYFLESFKFSIMNPETLINFFPFMYSYYFKQWSFNIAALIPYGYFGLLFSIFWSILFKVLFINTFICYTVLFIIIHIMLLIITHLYVKRDKGFEYKEVLE